MGFNCDNEMKSIPSPLICTPQKIYESNKAFFRHESQKKLLKENIKTNCLPSLTFYTKGQKYQLSCF